MRRVTYGDRAEAAQAARVLEDFGLLVSTSVELNTAEEVWEVCAHELPARRVATEDVVAPGPSPTPPSDTEQDDYYQGTSRWDEQWERDQERRDGY